MESDFNEYDNDGNLVGSEPPSGCFPVISAVLLIASVLYALFSSC